MIALIWALVRAAPPPPLDELVSPRSRRILPWPAFSRREPARRLRRGSRPADCSFSLLLPPAGLLFTFHYVKYVSLQARLAAKFPVLDCGKEILLVHI